MVKVEMAEAYHTEGEIIRYTILKKTPSKETRQLKVRIIIIIIIICTEMKRLRM
jgi:hypothetical protein